MLEPNTKFGQNYVNLIILLSVQMNRKREINKFSELFVEKVIKIVFHLKNHHYRTLYTL